MKLSFNLKFKLKITVSILFLFGSTFIISVLAASTLAVPVIGIASSINSKGFTANWTPVSNATGYTVKVFYGTTFVDSVNVAGQAIASVICPNLVPNTTFNYQVLAKGDGINYLDSPLSGASAAFTLLTAAIPVNKLKFIFKMDDFSRNYYSLPILDYAVANNLKINIGLITKTIDASSLTALTPYMSATNQNGDSLIEIWHHGLDHSNNAALPTWEFKNTTYADQKMHFDSANSIIERELKIQMHTFGAPYNASDANTNTVILANPNYKVFMLNYGPAIASSVFAMNDYVPMEKSAGLPFYQLFVTNYLNKKSTNTTGYMLTQMHPTTYTLGSAKYDQFKLIVNFLISEGVEFVRVYDYYRYLSQKAPSGLTGIAKRANCNSLSWTDNSSVATRFIVERSTDNINWTKIGTTPASVTTFEDVISSPMPVSYYRVCASCGIKSEYSTVCKVTNSLTSLNDNGADIQHVNIYQKSNKLVVSGLMNVGNKYTFELFNSSGQKITGLNSIPTLAGNFELDIKNLKSGIYYCQMQYNDVSIKKKVLIRN